MTKTQEEQEQELLLLNAELDQQLNAVEQRAESVLRHQREVAESGRHDALQTKLQSDLYEDSSTSVPPSSTRRVNMSPKVKKASRASAIRNSPAPDSNINSSNSTNSPSAHHLEKKNLNQQNQLRVQKLEIAQLNQEVAMLKEEIANINRERKAQHADYVAANKAANEFKRKLARVTKERDDANALCQKVRTKNKELDVQVRRTGFLASEVTATKHHNHHAF